MQLVGLACLRCKERIASVHDGTVCDECGSPVHRQCVTPGAASGVRCAACGSARTDIDAHAARADANRRERDGELRSHHLLRGLLTLLVGLMLVTVSALITFGSILHAMERGGGIVFLVYGGVFVGFGLIAKAVSHAVAYLRIGRGP
jgi:hypothetical protein